MIITLSIDKCLYIGWCYESLDILSYTRAERIYWMHRLITKASGAIAFSGPHIPPIDWLGCGGRGKWEGKHWHHIGEI